MKQQIKIILDTFMPLTVAFVVAMAMFQIVYGWLTGEE